MYDVAIAKNADAAAAIRAAVDLVGGIKAFVRPGERVLIKPNFLLSENKPGVVTTGAAIIAVTQLVLEAGGMPIVGEAGSVATGLDAFRNVGCFDFLTQHSVPMKNLNEDEMVDVDISGAKLLTKAKVAKTAIEVDKLITLPVLKTHDQCWTSLGIKNIKGILPMSEKMRSHQVGVEQAIVDLNLRFPAALVVIDGAWGLEGLGPANGDAVKMDLAIVGANALATDMVGALVIGLEPKQIKYLRYAIKDGIGPKSFDEIRVLGRSIDSVRRKFKTAQQAVEEQYHEMGIDVVARNVCSGCWAEFRHIYYELKDQRDKLQGYTFVLGSVKDPPRGDKVIVLGNCAKEASACGEYCAGCPPHHDDIAALLRQSIARNTAK